jgi:CubicO group peptidase (beta-lactamase class C family)
MSCTKSIVALVVGQAIAEGKIKGLDQAVADYYPEWRQGHKRSITIRQLLNHTSGIQQEGVADIYGAPDSVQLALAAELTSEPGNQFSYNNKAVNLLSGIIQRATGQPLDVYADSHLFKPMGIVNWKWLKDDAGTPRAMADLMMLGEDFAKFGQLVLDNGAWEGRPLVPATWIEELTRRSQPYEPSYGLLWWRLFDHVEATLDESKLVALGKDGCSVRFVEQLRVLKGKTYRSLAEWRWALAAALGPSWEELIRGELGLFGDLKIPSWSYGQPDGVCARGSLGQYLVVLPPFRVVAVRQLRPFKEYDATRDRFDDFPDRIRELASTLAWTPKKDERGALPQPTPDPQQ